ncbi:MAG: hypothetical protein NC132_06100 [Corallococcus sp.]|nr:hypothetical protein [Corallococcus sp.]MCM1360101.1 hypothetical protein [Corallococcus sp.]MCM1395658.1 hypothetical protein [Corallococcus sp.]
MNGKEPLCLQLRNQTTRNEETYCKCYQKKFRGYIRSLFINYQMVGVFLMMLFDALLVYFTKAWEDEDKLGFYIGATIFGICIVWWIYSAIKSLWFWKYSKHVVITNEGIWIMCYSVFWWSKDYTGKKRFLSPSWSLYGWSEIKITSDDKIRPRSPVKLANFFDDFDYAVIKSSHLTSLFMTRWDGMQQIDFLDKADADDILAYAKERHKRKKRKKKDMEIIEDEYGKLPDDEYAPNDEE